MSEPVIDIFRIATILMRRKAWIVAVFVASIVIVAVLNNLVEPVYRSEGTFSLRVDRVTGDLEMDLGPDTYELMALSDQVLEAVASRADQNVSVAQLRNEILSFRTDPNRRTLTVRAVANTPTAALQLLEAWHDTFEDYVATQLQDSIQQEVLFIDRQLSTIEAYGNLAFFDDLVAGDALTPEMLVDLAVWGEMARNVFELRSRRDHLLAIGESLREKEMIPAVIRPNLPIAPIAPRKSFNLAVGGFLGLFFGIGAVLIQEARRIRAAGLGLDGNPKRAMGRS